MRSPSRLALWAKLGTARYPELFHPLLFHMLDVGVVARRLWDRVLRPAVKERFSANLGLPQQACGPWVSFWVGAHDIGNGLRQFLLLRPLAHTHHGGGA